MSLSINLDLTEDDLKHFRLIMQHASSAAAHISPEDIVAGAEQLIHEIDEADTPPFVKERLVILRLMIAMLSDIEWRLPEEDRERVFKALSYFAEPEDLVPDNIPVIGYLDDAIMIEVVARDLNSEIQTYSDFCEFREKARSADPNAAIDREAWLKARREELQSAKRRSVAKTLNPKKLFSRS